MNSKIKPERENKALDLFMIIFLTLGFMVIFYMIPPNNLNLYTAPLLFIILVPTMMALIHGAPFVPTPMVAVEKMLKLAKIKSGDKVYDIGCGDGRMVYLAAKEYNADAVGFELSPLVYGMARVRHFFWRSKAKIRFGNFKTHDLSDADVIVCYLMPETLARLQAKLERELKKGAKVISYAFPVGTWTPAHREEKDASRNVAPIWVYEIK